MAYYLKKSSKRKSDSQNSDFLKKPRTQVNEDNFVSDTSKRGPYNDLVLITTL